MDHFEETLMKFESKYKFFLQANILQNVTKYRPLLVSFYLGSSQENNFSWLS